MVRVAAGSRLVLTYLTYPIADEPFVTKTGKRMMDAEGGAGRPSLRQFTRDFQFCTSDLFDAIIRQLKSLGGIEKITQELDSVEFF